MKALQEKLSRSPCDQLCSTSRTLTGALFCAKSATPLLSNQTNGSGRGFARHILNREL
jgi:hypothetical protein